MPKVKEGYFENKKNSILDTAEEILKTKPLYKLTMKDIIQETGLSTGAIYSSFSDIDDVIIALLNRFEVSTIIINETEKIITESNSPEEKIERLLKYFVRLTISTITRYGKFNYELGTVITDSARRQKIANGLSNSHMYNYAISNVTSIIEENINNGYFNPIISKQSIYALIFVFFDGLVRDLTLVKCYNVDEVPQLITFEEEDLPDALIYSVLHLLNKSK